MTTSQLITVDLFFLSSDVDCWLTVIYVVAFNCLLLGHDGFCFCFTFVPLVERAYRKLRQKPLITENRAVYAHLLNARSAEC
jgi:hypothetical protein